MSRRNRRVVCGVAAGTLVALTLTLAPAHAQKKTFTGTGKDGKNRALAASATFEFDAADANTLLITLTNTSMLDVLEPQQLLSAVFFSAGNADLSKDGGSVKLTEGSELYLNGVKQTRQENVSGEFAFEKQANGKWQFNKDYTTYKPQYGVSSTGLDGWFGSDDVFAGPKVPGTNNNPPDGLGMNLTSAGDNMSTGNGGVNSQTIAKNSVQIRLKRTAGTLDISSISDVWFHYGTSQGEPNFRFTESVYTPPPLNPSPVPEPAFYAPAVLFGGGLIGMFLVGRRRRAGQDAGGLLPT
jgi:hypothetical protein